MEPRIELVKKVIAEIDKGATTAREVSERLGVHFSTVTRHVKLCDLPTVQEMAKMTKTERKKLKLPDPPPPPPPEEPEPTWEEQRKAYMKRKEFGSKPVQCPRCKTRGVANIKITGRKQSVLCADCRRMKEAS